MKCVLIESMNHNETTIFVNIAQINKFENQKKQFDNEIIQISFFFSIVFN